MVLSVVALLACDGDERAADPAAFCAAVDALVESDPFADLLVASPAEMRAAFDQLTEGVDRVAAVAPEEVEPQARAYRESLTSLTDQLRGAGFDPRQVDALAYGRAAADHREAAESVENAAADLCR